MRYQLPSPIKSLAERRRIFAFFICLLLFALGLMTAKLRRVPQVDWFESRVASVMMPLQALLAKGTRQVRDIWYGYVDLTQVRQENIRLQQQAETLQGELHRYREAYLEQERLRALLGFRSLSFPHAVPAEVLGVDPSLWAEAITINKGADHNLQKDSAIVTHRGLVGHVVELAPRYATVLLLTDRRSAVDALVQRTRARGIVFGKSQDQLAFRYVSVREAVEVGDEIISSGLGDIYPKGIRIGTVISVRPQRHGLFYEISVRPAVEFRKLEEVLALEP
ncbi:rod shape-determining protein MreC [Candidatus Entotheonella palauensis]|uniref:rod shape-determining protein MreC n=1 Tax=Candidatus Entotheonella palauensis TaxID=93172 RepID=UPI000B7F9037|nr:rod shape-determining protein MreC [Candidatus Entotheonella palauensis]